MQSDQGFQPRLLVHGTVVLTQHVVQQSGNRVGHRVHRVHKHENKGAEEGTDLQPVLDADTLWDDFAKDHNQDRGQEDGLPTTPKTSVQHNRQRFIGDDVGEKQRDQDPVLALRYQVEHAVGQLLLGVRARRADDLQVHFVLAHQRKRQPGKDPTQQDQDDRDDVVRGESSLAAGAGAGAGAGVGAVPCTKPVRPRDQRERVYLGDGEDVVQEHVQPMRGARS